MRFTIVIATLGAALLAALAVTAGTSAGNASAASGSSATPSWSTPQPYQSITITGSNPPTGTLALISSVACVSYGNCVAAGVSENVSSELASAAVAVESNGQWGQPVVAPLPAGAAAAANEFTSVACSSATACAAVGAYGTSSNGAQPLAVPFTVSGSNVSFGTPEKVTLPSNALTTNSQAAFLSGVSCATGGCTAVGTYETTGDVWTAITATPGAGGAWTATAVTPPTGDTNDSVLTAISCPSTGACEAVGDSSNGSTDLQAWAVQVNGGAAGTGQAVAMPGGTITASVPTVGSALNLREGLTAVSCPSAGACTAVGTFEPSADEPGGVMFPITQGTPGQVSTLGGGAAEGFLNGIWCSDASDCVAVGGQVSGGEEIVGIAANETNGVWSTPVTMPAAAGTSGTAVLSITLSESVACTSPGVCVTAGFSVSETGSGSTETATEGSFFAYSALPPTITTSSLPAATVGKAYKATLQSGGGTGTSSWSVSQGSLPAGLTLNASTGVISGTPTRSGQSGFAVTVTNAGPPSLSNTANLSITVGAVASVKVAYARISGSTATVVLSCSGAKCAGAFKLTGVEHLRGKTPTAVAARAKQKVRKRTITLDSGRYSAKPGATEVLKVKLNRSGVTLLHRLGKLSGKLTLTRSGTKKPTLIRTLKFRYAAKRKH